MNREGNFSINSFNGNSLKLNNRSNYFLEPILEPSIFIGLMSFHEQTETSFTYHLCIIYNLNVVLLKLIRNFVDKCKEMLKIQRNTHH